MGRYMADKRGYFWYVEDPEELIVFEPYQRQYPARDDEVWRAALAVEVSSTAPTGDQKEDEIST